MRTTALSALLLLAGIASAAIEPAPATIITDDRPIEGASVDKETTAGVSFYLGDWKAPGAGKVEKKRGQYVRVIYTGDGEDGNYLRGEALHRNGENDKAQEFYKKATASAKWNWEIEDSYLKAADILARAKKADEALATLEEFGKRYPDTARIAELVSLRAQLRLQKGDADGATADFKLMAEKGAAWGATAELDGMMGQRNVLVSLKKFPEAVDLLKVYWAKQKAESAPDAFATVGLAIADDQKAAGKNDDSVATCRRIYLTALSTEAQCKAHLRHARILAEPNNTAGNISAFDQAAMAALIGADEVTQADAAKLARDLVINKLDKDKSLSDEDRKDYRSYLASF